MERVVKAENEASTRRELGLAVQGDDVEVRSLYDRSIKPLSRQQVREILDRYAADINSNSAGAVVISHSDELYGGVEKKTRESRVSLRDEINRSLSAKRGKHTDDIKLFEAFLFHQEDLYFIEEDQRVKLLSFAQSCLDTVRRRMNSNGSHDSAGTLRLELPGGAAVEFATGLDDADLAARLEDDVFALSNQVSAKGDDPTPEEYNLAYNKGVVGALCLPSGCGKPLPHNFAAMANELLAEARGLFGEGVVPKDSWIGDFAEGSLQDALEKMRRDIADRRKITPDDVRAHVRASLRAICVDRAVDQMLVRADRALALKTHVDAAVFMKREPAVVEALRRAETAEEVAKTLADADGKFKETAKAMAFANSFAKDAMERIALGIATKAALPARCVLEAMKKTEIAHAGGKIAKDIVAGGKASTRGEVADAFRAEIGKYVDARVAALAAIDALNLGPVATSKMKEQVLSLYRIEPKTYDLRKFREIADMLKDDVQRLVELFRDNANPTMEQVFEKFAPIRNKLYSAYSEKFSVQKFDLEDLAIAANAVFAMAVPEDTDMPERAIAFMNRKDVKAALAQMGAGNEPNVNTSYSFVACTMAHGTKGNAEIAASLGKDTFPPYHAKAVVEALHELGYTSVTGEVAMSVFREGPAFAELGRRIKASNAYVDPATLKRMVKEVVAANAAVRRDVARKADIAKVVGGDGEVAIRHRRLLDDKFKAVGAGLHDKVTGEIRTAALAQITSGFAKDMHDNCRYGKGQMAADYGRQFVQFGNSEPFKAKSFAELRDRYAQFLAKNPAARYDDLGAVDRRKADIVMSFMTQNPRNALVFATGIEFSKDGKGIPYSSSEQGSWLSKVDWAEDGGLVFAFDGVVEPHKMISLDAPMDPEDGGMARNEINCGDGSRISYSCRITLGADELERLASVDYGNFSTVDYDNHVRAPGAVNPYQTALGKIPEQFRVNMEFETAFSAVFT